MNPYPLFPQNWVERFTIFSVQSLVPDNGFPLSAEMGSAVFVCPNVYVMNIWDWISF